MKTTYTIAIAIVAIVIIIGGIVAYTYIRLCENYVVFWEVANLICIEQSL
jgi:hypothetical protein